MRNSEHPRLRVVLVAVLLGAFSVIVAGCANNYALTTDSELSFKGYEDNGATMVFHVTAGTTSSGQWRMRFTFLSPLPSGGFTFVRSGGPSSTPDCIVGTQSHWRQWPAYDFRIPTNNSGHIVAGDDVALHLSGRGGECNPGECFVPECVEDTAGAWTNYVTIPAYVPPTGAPVASLFAHATPVGLLGTLIDARLSTGTGTLSYAWSPTACAGTTYPLGFGHDGEAAPAGTALYTGAVATTCTVVVTGADGSSSSASLEMPAINRGLQNNGGLSFAGGSVAVTAIGPASPTQACLDLDNTGLFSVPVAMVWDPTLGAYKGSTPLTQTGAGLHRVSATLWAGDNVTCANTTATGAAQVISNLYTVDGAGAASEARRGLRSSSFVARSSLRFASSKTISEGTFDTKAGTIKGATMSGSFTWSTPASAKGVKRPVGAAKLAKGAYVMRSVDMMQGPLVGKASTLLGTGTVLLRGTDGTLACGTLAGGFDSSTLTLAGGTRTAKTLAGNVTGKRVTYVFPTPSGGAAKSGRASGMLATALGWLTGEQSTERAKKPAKKPVKVRPVKATGTASLQTAAKATGLPASCKALVRYLPQ